MLLTSSQVSAALTGGIISICTLALFVSGLVLQRQSVKNLNAALHPGGGRKGPWEKLVQKAEMALEVNDPAKYTLENLEFINRPDIPDEIPMPIEFDDEQTAQPSEPDWSRRAYVQMVTTADEICNAITAVTSLSIQGSRPRRLLVYPRAWGDNDNLKIFSKELELITIAKREHLLETMTTEQVAYDGGDLTDSLLNQDYDKLLYLQPSGLVLNATQLDQIFEISMGEEVLPLKSNETLAAALLQPRQSHKNKFEDAYDRSLSDFDGTIETLNSLRTIRSLDNAYNNGQLLGDLGYLHLGSVETSSVADDQADELRKRDYHLSDEPQLNPLESVVLERYYMDKETVCGDFAWV